MVNTKITALPAMTTPVGADVMPVVDDPGGTPATQKLTFNNLWNNFLKALAQLAFKEPCQLATTANITLSGEQTIDGVLTSTSRVLVKDQTTGSENGIYVTGAGAWARAADFDTSSDVVDGLMLRVVQGTLGANTTWYLDTDDPITLDTTALTFRDDISEDVVATKMSTDTKTTPLDDDYMQCADPDNASDSLKEFGLTLLNLWTNYIKVKAETNFQRSASASSSSGTLTLAYGSGPNFNTTLTENVTTLTITGWPASGTEGKIRLRITQDTTARTVAFTSVKWVGGSAPTVSTGSGAEDIYVLTSDDGGTNIYGHIVGQNYS